MIDHHICRAKCKDTGEWIYGYYVKHNTVQTCFDYDNPRPKHYIVNDGTACDWGFEPPLQVTEVDPDTVCRFIGLQDDNNKPIFENDVVRGKIYIGRGYSIHNRVIKYYLGCFKIKVGIEYKDIPYNCEVIGNIFDNPKLMEVNND